ncbi:hypothetical protein LSM04_003914 [Trypanosoma melophagium]|uniref:uncharacterized protein n=1 Tax=Trypanosoma melophagium TaxID=715481 RepID=UPI00351A40DD|nr:hypothetical protein LSM04_003914 [Trypanosoma melophagium]
MNQEHHRGVLGDVMTDVTSIFSDIDGTLVHYADTMRRMGYYPLSDDEREKEERHMQEHQEKLNKENNTPPFGSVNSLGDIVQSLLRWRYTAEMRRRRFTTLPLQLWRHQQTGRTLRMYELYNKTLCGALISEDTVLLLEFMQDLPTVSVSNGYALRHEDSLLVALITGARTTTHRCRRISGVLPQATYEACEGGGKLWCRRRSCSFSPNFTTPSHFSSSCDNNNNNNNNNNNSNSSGDFFLPMLYPHDAEVPLDTRWLQRFNSSTGAYDAVLNTADTKEEKMNNNKNKKTGTLWDVCALVREDGFTVDDVDMTTSFLIDIPRSPAVVCGSRFTTAAEAERYLAAQFHSLWGPKYNVDMCVNLNKGQVHAAGCGKKEVMTYILEESEVSFLSSQRQEEKEEKKNKKGRKEPPVKRDAVALFDDCNDIPFAMECGAGLLPSVAHEELLLHKAENHYNWFRTPHDGPLGTEWALQQILLFLMTKARR